MMLPGVELARKRRLHHHSIDPASASAAASFCGGAAASSSMAEPALAARIRLEEKLHGLSRLNRLARNSNSNGREKSQPAAQATNRRAAAAAAAAAGVPTRDPGAGGARLAFARTPSRVDLCAVCLEEVAEATEQRVTKLPCSHKYHSDCVLPWLAAHPDCPCCRSAVHPPSLNAPS